MGYYYKLECGSCEKQGGSISLYAGPRWDVDLLSTTKFLIHHLGRCEPSSFEVRYDDDPEFEARLDLDFVPATLGLFPHSDDWEEVAAAEDLVAFERTWSEQYQQILVEAEAGRRAELEDEEDEEDEDA